MSLGAQLSIQLLEHRCLSWAGNVFSMLKEMFMHFHLVFIGPDAVLLMHLIICSVGVKSFAHRTLLYFSSKVITHIWELYLSKFVRA